MTEHRQRQAGPGVVRLEDVLRAVQMLFEPGERCFQLHEEAGVVKGAVLDLPVGPGVAGDALLQSGDRFVTIGRERMQLSVTTASLEEAEEAGTGRYHWLEHDVSIRCGGRGGNGISVAGGSDGSCKGARAPESP
ncbi:hypothetical protein GCM10009664_53060 [Kitasatospora gansuensis]